MSLFFLSYISFLINHHEIKTFYFYFSPPHQIVSKLLGLLRSKSNSAKSVGQRDHKISILFINFIIIIIIILHTSQLVTQPSVLKKIHTEIFPYILKLFANWLSTSVAFIYSCVITHSSVTLLHLVS